MIILGTNSIKDTGYDVANSLRQNRADSSFLSKTFSGDGTHHDKGTISVWVKRSETGAEAMIYSAGASGREFIRFETNDTLTYRSLDEGFHLNTNRVFRDISAWYHIVVAFDSSQGTASNRQKIYVNGVQETSFATETYQPNQNTDHKILAAELQRLGKDSEQNGPYANCYYCEVVGIDGQQLAADQFGEFDEDSAIWKPIKVSGLTFGTNGFHLDFEDSSALGNDVSGNNNNFANTNFAATDQSTDTCPNNFCTWNSLDSFYSSATFSEGNTTVVTPNASLTYATGTVGLSNGRWYFEVQPFDPSDNNNIGIVDHVSTSNSSNAGELQFQPRGWCYRQAGDVYNNNSSVSGSWDAYSAGVTIGVFVDLVDNKIYWSRNGVMQNSGTGVTITAAASTDTGFYFPAVGDYVTNDDTTFKTNFGGSSSFTISSGVTDDNGYGTFEYTPNVTVDSTAKKFYSINTANLAEFG